MDSATAKRRLGRLRELLSRPEFAGQTQDRISELLGLPNGSYISRLLRGRKSLGEQAARKIEKLRGLPQYWFDDVEGVRKLEPSRIYGQPITPEEARIGREWGKLREPLRGHFVRAIELAVADQKTRRSKRKDVEADGEHPHSS